MPNTTVFEFGDVVLVPFPFTDQSASKRRPAAVISSESYNQRRPDLILAAITSQSGAVGGFAEVPVAEWESAGLLKPSLLKPVLATVSRQIVLKRLGRLTVADRERLTNLLKDVLG